MYSWRAVGSCSHGPTPNPLAFWRLTLSGAYDLQEGDTTMPLTTDPKMLNLSRNIIEAFDKADRGPHPGFRPAHAKGILLTGEFKPSPEAVGLTRAPHVQRVSIPVTVRFSNFAGFPTVADNDSQNASPRGFAVRFHLAEHVHTDIVGHSVDSFPTRTAEEFLEFINALIATDPAGPHPNAIEPFLFLKKLEDMGQLDNTIVVFTTDNGAESITFP